MPLGLKLNLARGSQFFIELYKENFKQLLLLTANGNLTKLSMNYSWVVPYRNYLNGSDWLHK